MPSCLLDEIRKQIAFLNREADIKFTDTVCHPTKRRQAAMQDLVKRVDAVVVVGGRNSNNTRRLAELCRQHDVPAFHVTAAEEIESQWFDGFEVIGLTAGTSTLDATIDAVHDRLERFAVEKSATGGVHASLPISEQSVHAACSEN